MHYRCKCLFFCASGDERSSVFTTLAQLSADYFKVLKFQVISSHFIKLVILFNMQIHAREPMYSNNAVIAHGCSRRVHRIVYLGVKGVIFWSIFYFANYCHL